MHIENLMGDSMINQHLDHLIMPTPSSNMQRRTPHSCKVQTIVVSQKILNNLKMTAHTRDIKERIVCELHPELKQLWGGLNHLSQRF